MQSCELVTMISSLACCIAKDKSPEDIAFLSNVLVQLGDTLATIATNEECLQKGASDIIEA